MIVCLQSISDQRGLKLGTVYGILIDICDSYSIFISLQDRQRKSTATNAITRMGAFINSKEGCSFANWTKANEFFKLAVG